MGISSSHILSYEKMEWREETVQEEGREVVGKEDVNEDDKQGDLEERKKTGRITNER